ncbi:MAG: type IV pilin protein [Magnetococcales bacterium]|nr:type IV pilin protein [Magnetococcales bacterium]
MPGCPRTGSLGFTLIELLIVLAIAAVLALVAVPAYQDAMIKGRRSDGKALLMQVANLQERWYTENMSYTASMLTLGFAADPQFSESRHYTVTILSPAAAATVLNTPCPVATCFVAVATPQSAQAKDGRLAISSTGVSFHDANNNGSYADSGENVW